jgi:hypothetical protein
MRIWKWTMAVADLQTVEMPRGAQVLSVQMQGGAPQLWALVDEDARTEPRTFATYGTGNPMPEVFTHGRFVDTYQMHGGSLVFHVFDQS